MSFYGSTYYQLIDAFGKIIFSNAGFNKTDFTTPTDATVGVAEAVGRKGVAQIDTGNRWIVLKKNEDNIFSFWHATPDTSASNSVIGMEKTSKPGSDDPCTILNSGDYIKLPSFKYDAAGHVVPSSQDSVYFQMPISETEKDIEDLQGRVTDLEEQVSEFDDRITENKNGVTSLNSTVGNLNVVYPTGTSEGASSLADAIGDLQTMLQKYNGMNLQGNNVSAILISLLEEVNEISAGFTTQNLANQTFESKINNLQASIDSLDARLKALEANS